MTLFGKRTHSDPMEDADAHNSWRRWFQLYGPRLLLCARQWTRSAADAEDALQEGFVRFWRRQRALGGDPLGLVLTSIRRAAVDEARARSRRGAREEQFGSLAEGAPPLFERLVEGDERRCEIEAALARLPAEQREVLVLKIWGELTFAEIAAQRGLSLNTVASRYRYALAALRERLTKADCHG